MEPLETQPQLTGPRLPAQVSPSPVDCDDSWFSINSIDADNMRFHLETTPAQQAWLVEALANAEYHMRIYEDAASTREAHVFMLYKCRPFTRLMAKQKGLIKVDASDDVCRMASKADLVACQYRQLAYQWRQIRDTYKGFMAAFETKRMFLASLCGLRRSEWDAENINRKME